MIAAALLLLLLQPAAAAKPDGSDAQAVQVQDGRLVLALGQAVTVEMIPTAGGVRPVVVETATAQSRMQDALMAFLAERAAAAQAQTGDQERLGPIRGGPARPPSPNQVRLTFGPGPDGRSVLLIAENGYDRVLDYRAVMRLAGGRSARTTICRVPGGLRVAESWSDPITALELGNFELLEPGPNPQAQVQVCD